jgi:AraC-like DNA-binding protein
MHTAWNTSLIPQYQRAEFWRSAVCDAFLAMTPRIPRTQDFEARLDHLPLERVYLNQVTAPAHGVSRTATDINRDDKHMFFVNMSPSGRCHVRQQGREHTALAGELILIESSSTYSIDLPDDGALLSLAVPREWLANACPQALDRTAQKIPESAASHLLAQQMIELTRIPEVDALQAGLISQAMVSLLAAALSVTGLKVLSAPSRLRKLQQLIAHHYIDPDFGPRQAADLAGISLRSLHLEFAKSGSTFGIELQNYRLQQARQALLNYDRYGLMSKVARDCGFKSAEHFSRCFRQRFGQAPSQLAAMRH